MNLLNSRVLSHKFFDKITKTHMLNFSDIIRRSVNKIAHHFIFQRFEKLFKRKMKCFEIITKQNLFHQFGNHYLH